MSDRKAGGIQVNGGPQFGYSCETLTPARILEVLDEAHIESEATHIPSCEYADGRYHKRLKLCHGSEPVDEKDEK